MKLTSLICTAVVTLTLGGVAAAQLAPATTSQTPPGGEGRAKMRLRFLSPEEQDKLEAARKKALESDPSLKAEIESLKQERRSLKGTKPAAEERQAMLAKSKELEEKIDAATIKADPSVAPILEKVKTHRHEMIEKFVRHKKDGAATPAAPAPTTPATN